MSVDESSDFSSLPPLPRQHVKHNGSQLEKKSIHQNVLDGVHIGKVVRTKEINEQIINDNGIYINNECTTTNKVQNIVDKETDILEEKYYDAKMDQIVDSQLIAETENLQLNKNHNSTQDGGSIGNVPSKFSSFGGSCSKTIIKCGSSANAEMYNMNNANRGHCLIFNNSQFESQTQLNERNGTDRDRDMLTLLFKDLGFDVHVFNNLNLSKLYSTLYDYAYGTDHSSNDCLVVFFLSHGEENMLYATDYSFESRKLFMNFTADNCSSLAGKPKMFFVQACRGTSVDDGVKLYHDNRDQTDYGSSYFYSIPVHADFLVCYSTIGEHYSWRNTVNGSWFIQSIVSVFKERALREDVLSMMTSVNRKMIIEFESNCPSLHEMHKKKQTASINSTLMRKIYLQPKQ